MNYGASATIILIVVDSVIFVVVMAMNNCRINNFSFQGECMAGFLGRFSFQPFRENPLVGPSSYTLTNMGAIRWDNIVHQHQAWRLFTSIWLHGGLLDFLPNILTLLFIGIHLERQFGFVRVAIIYIISGFGGNVICSLFIRRSSISVGASGAVFGLLGAMASQVFTNWPLNSKKVKAISLLTVLVITIAHLALGIFLHIHYVDHVGGFMVGSLLGFILLPRPQYGPLELRHIHAGVRLKAKYQAYQYMLGIISLILLIVGLSIGLVVLFNNS